jgi:hypothetical protein
MNCLSWDCEMWYTEQKHTCEWDMKLFESTVKNMVMMFNF